LEGEQEREENIEGTMEARGTSPKTVTDDAMTTSVAEEAGNTFSVGNNKACFNKVEKMDAVMICPQ